MKIAVKVINLPSREDRRRHMTQQLEGVTLPWSFFDARKEPPPDLPYHPETALWARGRPLTPGELGVFASHVALWRWLVSESDLDLLCVLEDDVIVDSVFFNRIPEMYAAEPWLHYLRLYAKVPVPMTYVKLAFGRHLVRYRLPVFGAQGYLITRHGAATFLRSIRSVVRPIDDEMDRFWAHGLPIYSVYPFPLMESDLGSSIEPVRRTLPALDSLTAVRRLAFRATEKSRRFASNLSADVKQRLGKTK